MNMVADANYLYRALMDARNDAREAKAAGLPDDMVGMGRLGVYNAFKAVTGLGDPQDRQLQEKGISGLLTWVFGKGSPKCHDDETDILTEKGFIPLKDYDGSFPCAWVDISGGKEDVRMDLPGKVRHIRHLGQMIRFAGPGLDLLVTPNHRCLATWSATADVRRYQMVDALRLYESRTPFYMLTAWESTDDGGPRLVRPSEVSMEEFDGTVHSVTVPSGITVVRRKGPWPSPETAASSSVLWWVAPLTWPAGPLSTWTRSLSWMKWVCPRSRPGSCTRTSWSDGWSRTGRRFCKPLRRFLSVPARPRRRWRK